MQNKKLIALVGLMGVGKTTIGAKLAERLKYYFIDCDREIEDRQQRSIREIFAQSGEKYFRNFEADVVKEISLRDEEIVFSLGGGAFMREETRNILKEKAVTIWLYASVDEILLRIGNKNNRPLLNNSKKHKREILEDLAAKRYPFYALSDFKFDTAKESHEAIISKIIKIISAKS